jgi:hypothetical protein
MDILPGAAGTGPVHGSSVIVELQSHPDRIIPGPRHQTGHDRRIDAARHGNDNALAVS